MHPSSPMPLSAMCEGLRGRSGGGGPNQTKNKKTLNQNQNQTKATMRALGLRKIGDVNTLPDRPEIRGMIARVPHLIEVTRKGA